MVGLPLITTIYNPAIPLGDTIYDPKKSPAGGVSKLKMFPTCHDRNSENATTSSPRHAHRLKPTATRSQRQTAKVQHIRVTVGFTMVHLGYFFYLTWLQDSTRPLKSLKPNCTSFEFEESPPYFQLQSFSQRVRQLLAGARFVHVCCTTEPGCTSRTAGCPTFPRRKASASTRRIRIRTAKTVKSEHLHAFASPFFSTIRLFLSLGMPWLKGGVWGQDCGKNEKKNNQM